MKFFHLTEPNFSLVGKIENKKTILLNTDIEIY